MRHHTARRIGLQLRVKEAPKHFLVADLDVKDAPGLPKRCEPIAEVRTSAFFPGFGGTG